MKAPLFRALCALLAGLAVAPAPALAQYPDKPIRIIVPYPPGTGTDTIARYTARRMEGELGKPVVVENRAGGNAIIAAQLVATSPPDGYTLLFAANGPASTNVALYQHLPYDPVKDLTPLARLAFGPMGLFVPANSPYKTAEELFEATRKQPGRINYGSGSTTYQIAGEWLMSLVGGKANVISYKGAAPALTDLAGGQVDFVIADYSGATALLAAGKIRMLAATTDRRLAAQPGIPTVQELGYKDFFQVAWWGMFAPAKTPEAVTSRLEQALLKIYRDKDTADFLAQSNYVLFLADGKGFGEFQRKEIQRESRLVDQFKIPKQ
ncbi:Bug family tripartite tricarboxylate transporter substrate binding protein [Bordetella flabilis]|uniref:ABC transporter substrate-binding protein n=1 Tax=Bordetella flabilis TaxID=463014 RepID=A0A193GES9_9BORD|nr:tripartite tricarboxylate transporter substrate binding protein [Bordetella flabilis]ANN77956.1 ABC transporter substrate-binding protein [Bordetella flabilis]